MVTVKVWILVAFLNVGTRGPGTPVVVDNIASEKACYSMAHLISKADINTDKVNCYQVEKVVVK